MFDKNAKFAIFIASMPLIVVGACVGDDAAKDSTTTGADAAPTGTEAGAGADAAPPPQDDGAAPLDDADVSDASRPIQCPAEGCQSCVDLLARNAGLPSGTYSIDPDGAGSTFSAMDAYCDNETDGGGWTLVLNYVHATDPADWDGVAKSSSFEHTRAAIEVDDRMQTALVLDLRSRRLFAWFRDAMGNLVSTLKTGGPEPATSVPRASPRDPGSSDASR